MKVKKKLLVGGAALVLLGAAAYQLVRSAARGFCVSRRGPKKGFF